MTRYYFYGNLVFYRSETVQCQLASLPEYTLRNSGFFVLAVASGLPLDRHRLKSPTDQTSVSASPHRLSGMG